MRASTTRPAGSGLRSSWRNLRVTPAAGRYKASKASPQPAASAAGGSATRHDVVIGDAMQVPVVVHVGQLDRDLGCRRGVSGVLGVDVPEVVVGVADVQRGRAVVDRLHIDSPELDAVVVVARLILGVVFALPTHSLCRSAQGVN